MVFNRAVLAELFEHVVQRVTGALGGVMTTWAPWMVFVEAFNAHHVERWRLYSAKADDLPQTIDVVDQLHEASEYELYDVFAFHVSRLAKVKRRSLLYKDIGMCCFYQDGQAIEGCDVEKMISGLAEIFGLDYVACHNHLRLLQKGGKTAHEILAARNETLAKEREAQKQKEILAV
jgi:hypothetical protein